MRFNFSERLVHWYKLNKRDLPWRNTQDPYRIWLSEIILQQTRVDQGMSYYLKFVKEFPTIHQLAKASEEKVLKMWQGLGYYSRARNLHATAKTVSKDMKGNFPASFEDILKLKGVGVYTAAAIASFAFNKPHAVVDGNVYRVLSRVFGLKTPIDSTKGKKDFNELANALIDIRNPALFNQAIMEFGAIQCKPQKPDCSNCVLNYTCYARQKNRVAWLPIKEKTTKQRDRHFNYLVIRSKNSILLNKRTEKDIWKNLYDFPLVETGRSVSEPDFLNSEESKKIIKTKKYTLKSVSSTYKHILSHQRIYAKFWEIAVAKPLPIEKNISVPLSKLEKYAVPRLIENYLRDRRLL